jgi:hypothetical protein
MALSLTSRRAPRARPRPFTINPPPPPYPTLFLYKKHNQKHARTHQHQRQYCASGKSAVCARVMNFVSTIACLPPPATRCRFVRNSPHRARSVTGSTRNAASASSASAAAT